MRAVILVMALVVGACAAGSQQGAVSTTSTTEPRPPTTTTLVPPLQVELDDCAIPQVTFSPLCETYKLIEEWHVDGPPDPAVLARAALDGLLAFETTEVAEPPRTLICAIPHPSFESLCTALALRVGEQSIPIGAAIERAVIAMTETGLDPFSYYVPPSQVSAFRANGVVGGVGLLLDANDAAGSRCARISPVCELTVVFVLEDNPGADAGLQADDVIIAVDGTNVDGLGFLDAGALIAGDETGSLNLTIEREGQMLDFAIARSELTIPTVRVELPLPGVGYIRIPDFEPDIADLVVEGLGILDVESYSTLIVDLRDNPGGFVDVAVAVISEFVDEGTIFTESNGGEDTEYTATPGGLATDKRLVVLVNQGTASAGEIMAAALRDDRNAVIIGESTFGKNAIQIVFDLNNGGELHLAVARWLSPDGVTVAGRGLVPDHLVDLPADMAIEDLTSLALEYAG